MAVKSMFLGDCACNTCLNKTGDLIYKITSSQFVRSFTNAPGGFSGYNYYLQPAVEVKVSKADVNKLKDGVTTFERRYDVDRTGPNLRTQAIELTAPAFLPDGGPFLRWTWKQTGINLLGQPFSQEGEFPIGQRVITTVVFDISLTPAPSVLFYFVYIDGELKGPYTRDQLGKLYRAGKINDDTIYARTTTAEPPTGDVNWREIRDLSILFKKATGTYTAVYADKFGNWGQRCIIPPANNCQCPQIPFGGVAGEATVPSDAYFSYISNADANAKALNAACELAAPLAVPHRCADFYGYSNFVPITFATPYYREVLDHPELTGWVGSGTIQVGQWVKVKTFYPNGIDVYSLTTSKCKQALALPSGISGTNVSYFDVVDLMASNPPANFNFQRRFKGGWAPIVYQKNDVVYYAIPGMSGYWVAIAATTGAQAPGLNSPVWKPEDLTRPPLNENPGGRRFKNWSEKTEWDVSDAVRPASSFWIYAKPPSGNPCTVSTLDLTGVFTITPASAVTTAEREFQYQPCEGPFNDYKTEVVHEWGNLPGFTCTFSYPALRDAIIAAQGSGSQFNRAAPDDLSLFGAVTLLNGGIVSVELGQARWPYSFVYPNFNCAADMAIAKRLVDISVTETQLVFKFRFELQFGILVACCSRDECSYHMAVTVPLAAVTQTVELKEEMTYPAP
jgi:hypothetical protein